MRFGQSAGIAVAHTSGKRIRHLHGTKQHYDHQSHGHEKQHACEKRIDIAYDLVDGEHRGQQIIDEYHHSPESGVKAFRGKGCKQTGGGDHKDTSHKDKKHH